MTVNYRHRVRTRLRYRADLIVSGGIAGIVAFIGVALAVAVFAVAIVVWIAGKGPGDEPTSFVEATWIALTRSLDPGTFGQDNGHWFRLAGLAITLLGILALALLIGLIAGAVDQRLHFLRSGRSRVIESDHILILGRNTKLPLLVSELLLGDSHEHRAFVILSEADKSEVEESIAGATRGTRRRILVRRGDVSSPADLHGVGVEDAHAILVLRPDTDDGDAHVVQAALAVLQSRQGLPEVPVICELLDGDIGQALLRATNDQVVVVISGNIVARVAAQSIEAAGLGAVYEELLDFEGDELYVVPVPDACTGKSFGDSLLAFERATPLAVLAPSGESIVSPDVRRPFQPGDSLVVLAEDFSGARPRATVPAWTPGVMAELPRRETAKVETLIVGWNSLGREIAMELDSRVAAGSRLSVFISSPDIAPQVEAIRGNLSRQDLSVTIGSTIDYLMVERIVADGPFDHILVLCDTQGSEVASDARTLLTLVHLRRALQQLPSRHSDANLVTQLLEPKAVELARVAQPDDFIVSHRLVGTLLAQLIEDSRLNDVLQTLLGSGGPTLRIVTVTDICPPGTYSAADLVATARDMGIILLGWRTRAGVEDPAVVRLNPAKGETVRLSAGDALVVLTSAQDSHRDHSQELTSSTGGHHGR